MVGMAVMMAMHGVPKERPLTHDLIVSILAAYEARRVEIDGCEYREGLQAVRIAGGVAGNIVPEPGGFSMPTAVAETMPSTSIPASRW